MTGMPEAVWEDYALDVLGGLAWEYRPGTDVSPGAGARESWAELILVDRLREAIERLNPGLPPGAVDEAVGIVTTAKSRDAYAENKQAHEYLVKGIRSVVYTDEFGAEHTPTIRLIDVKNPEANSFLAANQVMVVDGEKRARFDVVLYVNGLPLAVIELKKAADERATTETAHAQVVNYVADVPLAFRYNAVCLVSDGVAAKYGTAFTPYEHFAPWNVDDEGEPVDSAHPANADELALDLALHGLFTQHRFIDLVQNFVNFTGTGKRLAKPHQYFAVNRAVRKLVDASRSDGRAGVVWHTQGSGKSEEMVLVAHLAAVDPALGNPTIVVITDRIDLDDQLFSTFQDSEILTERPIQVTTREQLREELAGKRTGGILFTTLQKFGLTRAERESGARHPLLSDRRNVLVIVDEAHRSHYDNLDGYARHLRNALPHATLLAFTGTPISKAERNTRDVFGDYIDIYDLKRAADDGATVRVYHESRLIDLAIPSGADLEALDRQADQLTEGLDDAQRRRAVQAATVLDQVYGAPARIAELAADLVSHWEARSERMRPFIGGPGKAMVVCATRRICVNLYDALVALRPGWHDPAVEKGKVKIVFTSYQRDDPPEFTPHALRPSQRRIVQARAKDPDDELELLIVHSMLLTGFDAPPVHTMYMDRPMRDANLMQALARVNRRFREKQDGLLVGYAPLTENLHRALAEYTGGDQQDQTLGRDVEQAVAEVRNEHAAICAMLDGIDWRTRLQKARRTKHYINAVLAVVEHLRSPATPGNLVGPDDADLATRYRLAASRLERFFALCSTSRDLADLLDDIGFFADVRKWMVKFDAQDRAAHGLPMPADVQYYLAQLAASAIEAEGVTDLYAAAGMDPPDLSHLDEAYIRKLQESATPHLHAEALRRLIEQKMREVTRHNVVRQERFSERLQVLMYKYVNQQLTSAQIIAELVALAQEVAADANRGASFSPPLNTAELAFFDAIRNNPAAVDVMGTDVLARIARDLVASVRRSITTDWMAREPVRAKLRSTIRRLLARHGYPPDHQHEAIDLVIRQMEAFAEDWSPNAEQ